MCDLEIEAAEAIGIAIEVTQHDQRSMMQTKGASNLKVWQGGLFVSVHKHNSTVYMMYGSLMVNNF